MKKKLSLIKYMVFMIFVCTCIVYGMNKYYTNKINQIQLASKSNIASIKASYKEKKLNNKTYEYLYNETNKDYGKVVYKYKQLKLDFKNYKESIAVAKNTIKYDRSGNGKITKFAPINISELNTWIKKKAPKNSPFIGKGKMFIEISQKTGLDPKYLVAHAALESTWGTSKIAKIKGNYFGIGAYNSSPYSSAHKFHSNLEAGVYEGAQWIKDHYIDKGQDTLHKMIFGKKTYCVDNNGNPSRSWIHKISSIMR